MMTVSTSCIALGITEDQVALGSHLIHFWQNDEEFERGVRFLDPGLEDKSQFCVLFGHDEANQRVLEILREKYSELDDPIRQGRLTVLRRESPAARTLDTVAAAFESAMQNGASVIRYLGNLGIGQAALPGKGADEVVEVERGVTRLAERYPCVIVCMYDINTVSGRLVLQAGFGTHPLAVCGHTLQQNSWFTPEEDAAQVSPAA